MAPKNKTLIMPALHLVASETGGRFGVVGGFFPAAGLNVKDLAILAANRAPAPDMAVSSFLLFARGS